MILLWGMTDDVPMAAVLHSLSKRGDVPMTFLDQRQEGDYDIELSIDNKGQPRGHVSMGTEVIDLQQVTSVYLRPHDPFKFADQLDEKTGYENPALSRRLMFEDSLLCWLELTPALVVNRPSAMASNNSKPYQAAIIGEHGMKTPETLITTDPLVVEEFWREHGQIIYKSISGVRSIVSRLGAEHRARLKNVSACPTQFQEYIAGNEYRVHVVGEAIFACRITCDSDDYRYSSRHGQPIAIEPCILPPDVLDRCRRLTESLHLSVAGIDLRCTPDDKWYCFEVNPSPGFTFYQQFTGQPIGDSIASLLSRKV